MSYATVEEGLLKVIRKADSFNASNTSPGDYRILARGNRQAAVLNPGPFRREVVAAPRRIAWTWIVNIELFVPFREELSVVSKDLRVIRQSLMDIVDQFPHLDDTEGVIDAIIESGSEPDLWQGENKRWWNVLTGYLFYRKNPSILISGAKFT